MLLHEKRLQAKIITGKMLLQANITRGKKMLHKISHEGKKSLQAKTVARVIAVDHSQL